jgi:hypothetical protein
MSDDPIQELEAAAKARDVDMAVLLKDAKVAQTTWWRWRKGTFEPRPSTLRRLRKSLDDLSAEKAA